MKTLFVLFSTLFGLFALSFLFSPDVSAETRYFVPADQVNSTQARVQRNVRDAWEQTKTLGCREDFRVGGFHNGYDRLTPYVQVQVTDPRGKTRKVMNGGWVSSRYAGEYTVSVSTIGRSEEFTRQTATVKVNCPQPSVSPTPSPTPRPSAPASTSCSHQNTQARVQKDESQPWTQNLKINCFESFRVGSFHNGTGQFATDTIVKIQGQGINGNWQFKNGDTIHVPFRGRYTVQVTTRDQRGTACEERATVEVSCNYQYWR